MLKRFFERLKLWLGRTDKSCRSVPFVEKPSLSSSCGGLKVCVLESFAVMRERYLRFLERHGFSCFITSSIDEFMASLEGCALAVVGDCQPSINGFTLASKIKASFSIPVIVCTANCSLEASEEFKVSGADLLLFKPFDEGKFIERLKRLLVKDNALPVEEKPAPKKRGRKPYTFLDVAEKHVSEFSASGMSKAEFARKNHISLSALKNEFRLVALPLPVKALIKSNADVFKKSFFEYICKLKDGQSIADLCNEIAERGKIGTYYDLASLKARVDEYLKLEKKDEIQKTD